MCPSQLENLSKTMFLKDKKINPAGHWPIVLFPPGDSLGPETYRKYDGLSGLLFPLLPRSTLGMPATLASGGIGGFHAYICVRGVHGAAAGEWSWRRVSAQSTH